MKILSIIIVAIIATIVVVTAESTGPDTNPIRNKDPKNTTEAKTVSRKNDDAAAIERYILDVLQKSSETLTKAVELDRGRELVEALKFYLEGVGHLEAVIIALNFTSWTAKQKMIFKTTYAENSQIYLDRADFLINRLRSPQHLSTSKFETESSKNSTRSTNEQVKLNLIPKWIDRFATYAFLQFVSKIAICAKILTLFQF